MSTTFNFSVLGNRYFFTPKFTITTLILLIVLLVLGIWQWKSAEDMSETIELVNKRLVLNPINLDDLEKGGDWRFYTIQLQGSFDNEHQILIPNKMYKGNRGFQVLTPFKPSNSSIEILVNRGWISGDPSEKMPAFEAIPDGVSIMGILSPPLPLLLGASFNNITWPLISKHIDIEEFSKVLKAPLYPYVVLLSPGSQYGFLREWISLNSAIDPARHYGYARQWFVLAFVVLLVFVFMNVHRV